MPNHTPADPRTRPAADGPTSLRPADHDAVTAWLAPVEAGRMGTHLRPTAELLEAESPPADPAVRKRVLANERLIGRMACWR